MRAARAAVDRLLDRAVARSDRAAEVLAELRRENPGATPAQVLSLLDERYVKRVARLGGAVGAVAAVPALGTVTAGVLTAGQLGSFLNASGDYVMAAASLHEVEVDDAERRRLLLLASLLGEEGAAAVQGQLGLGTLYWAKGALTKLPLGTVRAVNRGLTGRLLTWGVGRVGALALGRLAPFGVGAVVGFYGTRVFARNVVEGTAQALGPVPARFDDPVPA